MSTLSDTRTADSRRKADKRYMRHPFLTFILLFSLIFSGFIILSVVPFSFFLNYDPDFHYWDIPYGDFEYEFDPFDFELPEMDFPDLFDVIMFNATPLLEQHSWRGEIFDVYAGTDTWTKVDDTYTPVAEVAPGTGARNKTIMFETTQLTRSTFQVTYPHYAVEDGIVGISDIEIEYSDMRPIGGDYYELIEVDDYGSYRVICGPIDAGILTQVNITIEYDNKIIGDYSGVTTRNVTDVSAPILSQYTQIQGSPGPGWSSVVQLASALDNETGGSSASIYDKATYLESWLKTYYNYSLNYSRYLYTPPTSQDVVYNFLFARGGDHHHNITVNGTDFLRVEDGLPGEGICMDYAASFVMLLRLMGIPARYATGFASSTLTRDIPTQLESVYAIQAHAWAEVYLPQDGGGGIWWPFEPTGSIISEEPPQPDQVGEDFGDGAPGDPGSGGEMPEGDGPVFGGEEGGFGEGVGGDPGTGVGGMGGGEGIWGIGTNPYGDSRVTVTVSPVLPNKYFKITSYDLYNPTDWTQSSTNRYNSSIMNVTAALPGAEEYNVTMTINATGNSTIDNPFFEVPLISLSCFNSSLGTPKLINNTFMTNASPSNIVMHGLITDDYGTLILNASYVNIMETGYIYQITYNITFEDIDFTEIKSQIPANSLDQPGYPVPNPIQIDYTQYPGIITQSLIDFINNTLKLDNDVYNTTLNIIEYLKTNYVFTPLIGRNGYDLDAFLTTNMGTAGDFATALCMFLRVLNVSSRLVWGGVGYAISGSERLITNGHFWTEVWIPNGTDVGHGYWVQFDPTPFPDMMYDIINDNGFAPRVDDDQVETLHYDMYIQTNLTAPYGYVNRGDTINIGTCIYRNNNTHFYYDATSRMNETLAGESVNASFYDAGNSTYFAINVTANSSGYINTTYFIDASLKIGPHAIIASHFGLFNDTLFSLDGIVNISLFSITPQNVARSLTPMTITGELRDPVKDEGLNGLYLSMNTSQEWLNPNQTQTDQNGAFSDIFNLNSTHPIGEYNITAYFNGTFNLTYPYPYNLVRPNSIYIPGLENVSQTIAGVTNITSYAGTLIDNFTVECVGWPGEKLVNGFDTILRGNLLFDNVTGMEGYQVSFIWDNGTRYNVSNTYTGINGSFELSYTVPSDHPAIEVSMFANFTSNDSSIVGTERDYDPIPKTPVYVHVQSAAPSNVSLGVDTLNVIGNVTFLNGTGYGGLPFYITLNNSKIYSPSFITNASAPNQGNFTASLTIPAANFTVGTYNISINSSNFITHPIKVNATGSTTKNVNATQATNMSLSNIQINSTTYDVANLEYFEKFESVQIEGYLNDTNGNPVISGEDITFFLGSENLGFVTTDGAGKFDFTFQITSGLLQEQDIMMQFNGTEYFGNSSENATIYIFDTVNVLINDPTPLGTKGIGDTIVVWGTVTDGVANPIKRRAVYIDFNNSQQGYVLAGETNDLGQYSHTNSTTHDVGNYNCSAVLYSISLSRSISKYYDVNASTSIPTFSVKNDTFAQGAAILYIQKGEYVQITGTLNLESSAWSVATYGNANITAWLDGATYLGSDLVDGTGAFDFEVFINPAVGTYYIEIRFDGKPHIDSTTVTYNNLRVFEDAGLTLTFTIDGNNAANTITTGLVGDSFVFAGSVTSGIFPGGIGYRNITIFYENDTITGPVVMLKTAADGTFSHNYQSMGDLQYRGDFNITMGIVAQNGQNFSITLPYNVRINHTPSFVIKEIRDPNDGLYETLYPATTLFFFVNETLEIYGNFYQSSPSFTTASLDLDLYNSTGVVGSDSTSIGTGYFYFSYDLDNLASTGSHDFMIKYDGIGPYDDPTSFNFSIYIFDNTTLILTLNTPADAYNSEPHTVTGTFTHNGVPIQGRSVNCYQIDPYSGLGASGVTSATGVFSFTFTTPNTDYTQSSYYVSFYDNNPVFVLNSSEVVLTFIGSKPIPPFNWIPVIIILVVAALAVVGTIITQRVLKMQKEKKAKEVDFKRIKNRMDMLLAGKRYREVIVFNFENLLYLINGYLRRKPGPGETYREFILDIIKHVRTYISPDLLISFVSLYEEARWSTHPVNLEMVKETDEYYNKLFKKIVGLTPEDYIAEKEEIKKITTTTSSTNVSQDQKATT